MIWVRPALLPLVRRKFDVIVLRAWEGYLSYLEKYLSIRKMSNVDYLPNISRSVVSAPPLIFRIVA